MLFSSFNLCFLPNPLALSAPPFPTHSPYVSPRLPQMAPSYPPAFVLYRLVSTGHFTPVSRNPLVVATARENHVRLGRRNPTSVMPRGRNFIHWGRSGQVRSGHRVYVIILGTFILRTDQARRTVVKFLSSGTEETRFG